MTTSSDDDQGIADTEPYFHCPPSIKLPRTKYEILNVINHISNEDKPINPYDGNRIDVTIQLLIRQRYLLVLEPEKGQRVTMEDRFLVSPELPIQFKIPLRHFFCQYNLHHTRRSELMSILSSFQITGNLANFLKTHIQRNVRDLVSKIGHQKEFKTVLSVLVTKIDLADVKECERIRWRQV